MTVEQGAEHARTGGFGDCACNAGKVVIGLCIHGSFAGEMLVLVFQDTAYSFRLPEKFMHEVIAAISSTDPYPYYAFLARSPCLVWQDGLWIAARPELVREVMTHPACRVRPVEEPVPAALVGGSAGDVFGALVRMNDGARHAAGKAALQRALANVPLDEVHATAGRIAREAWDECAGADGVSAAAVTRWMMEVPVRSVASLLGFRDAQLSEISLLAGRFVACLSPQSSAAQIEAAHGAVEELLAAFDTMLRSQRGDSEDEHAILANLVGLLSQTYEATAGLVGNTLVALQRGAPWPQRQEDALALVREVAQRDPVVQNTRRFVAEDAHISGVDVKKGDVILVVLAAGGAPFGHGAHKCPGQAMAETIAAAAIGVIPTLPALSSLLEKPGSLAWRYRASVNARIPEFMEAI
jgi:cytochrome P450